MMMGFCGRGVVDQGWRGGRLEVRVEEGGAATGWVRGDPVSVGRYEDCDYVYVCAELPNSRIEYRPV
jgi:hypothetical protein